MEKNQKIKLSNAFIWLGVLAWLPYIISRLLGIDLSGIPFLIAHLIGVGGGIYFRRQADAGAAPPSKSIQRLKTISTILLVTGVSVWGVYFGLQWITGEERVVTPFLITHLTFVLSGAGIKLYTFTTRK